MFNACRDENMRIFFKAHNGPQAGETVGKKDQANKHFLCKIWQSFCICCCSCRKPSKHVVVLLSRCTKRHSAEVVKELRLPSQGHHKWALPTKLCFCSLYPPRCTASRDAYKPEECADTLETPRQVQRNLWVTVLRRKQFTANNRASSLQALPKRCL